MYRYCFLVLLLCYNVNCDDCVTYTFEENENENFTNTYGICPGMRMWNVGKYSSLDIESPHKLSTRFLHPQSALSCVSSFKFLLTTSATLEVNVYMEPTTTLDQITVLVFQSLSGGADPTVGNAVLSPLDPNFTPGWHTIRVQIIGTGTYEGYVSFLGMASESSILLIDSFRYIAPSLDSDLCIIYKDEPEEETTILPTIATTQPATIEDTTLFASTDVTTDSTIKEAATPSITTVETTVSITTVETTPSITTVETTPSITTVETTPTIVFEENSTTSAITYTPSITTEETVPSTIAITTIPTTTVPTTTTKEETTVITTESDKPIPTTVVTIPSTTFEDATPSKTTNQTTITAATTGSTKAIVTTPATTAEPSTPSSTTVVTTPSTTTSATTPSTTTTKKVTTTTAATPSTQPPCCTTQRPNLSISLLLLKINKFFR